MVSLTNPLRNFKMFLEHMLTPVSQIGCRPHDVCGISGPALPKFLRLRHVAAVPGLEGIQQRDDVLAVAAQDEVSKESLKAVHHILVSSA
jgi:hypothetical protein